MRLVDGKEKMQQNHCRTGLGIPNQQVTCLEGSDHE